MCECCLGVVLNLHWSHRQFFLSQTASLTGALNIIALKNIMGPRIDSYRSTFWYKLHTPTFWNGWSFWTQSSDATFGKLDLVVCLFMGQTNYLYNWLFIYLLPWHVPASTKIQWSVKHGKLNMSDHQMLCRYFAHGTPRLSAVLTFNRFSLRSRCHIVCFCFKSWRLPLPLTFDKLLFVELGTCKRIATFLSSTYFSL